MAWADLELSTDLSLTKIESEASSLASFSLGVGDIADIGTEGFLRYFKTEEDYSLVLKIGMVIKSEADYNLCQITSITVDETDGTDTKYYVTPVDLTNFKDAGFSYATQESKIAQAKIFLGNALTSFLRNSNYRSYVNELNGDDILDLIVINDSIKLTSDYLTISLIYEDLKQINSNYENKYFFYDKKYKELLQQCLNLLDLDLDMNETTDVKGARISYSTTIRK